jgi:predicted component of type VI protein secretion system
MKNIQKSLDWMWANAQATFDNKRLTFGQLTVAAATATAAIGVAVTIEGSKVAGKLAKEVWKNDSVKEAVGVAVCAVATPVTVPLAAAGAVLDVIQDKKD